MLWLSKRAGPLPKPKLLLLQRLLLLLLPPAAAAVCENTPEPSGATRKKR